MQVKAGYNSMMNYIRKDPQINKQIAADIKNGMTKQQLDPEVR